jgi:hypothetical protein
MTTGEELARTRRRLRLSLRELSKRTRIPTRRLTAIELMNDAGLSDKALVAEDVRAVAAALGLDDVATANAYIAEFAAFEKFVPKTTDTSDVTTIELTDTESALDQFAAEEPSPYCSATDAVVAADARPDPPLAAPESKDDRTLVAPVISAPERVPIVQPTTVRPSSRRVVFALTAAAVVALAAGVWSVAAGSKPARSIVAPAHDARDTTATDGPAPAATVDQPVDARAGVPVSESAATAAPPVAEAARDGAIARRENGTAVTPPSSTDAAGTTNAEVNEGTAPSQDDLSGWWMLTNQIVQSNIASYQELTLGFRLQLDQDGNRVHGRGFKWTENGRRVPPRGQTPIAVDGTIEGRRLALTFVERGLRRSSHGNFQMQLAADGSLSGRFATDAAQSSGRSRAVRLQSR